MYIDLDPHAMVRSETITSIRVFESPARIVVFHGCQRWIGSFESLDDAEQRYRELCKLIRDGQQPTECAQ